MMIWMMKKSVKVTEDKERPRKCHKQEEDMTTK